jgi:histone-lysine N-methyltransferase SUV420H
VTARRYIKKGEVVKYLCGVQVTLTTEEEDEIKERKRDFSIVISARKLSASLFLGPARFANHDCDANARLMTTGQAGMEIIAARDIEIGEEITVTYAENYFGEDNCECLCATCEQKKQNGWEQEGEEDSIDAAPAESIEPESGGYSFRRRRKCEDSSRTPSATPDIRPRVPKNKKPKGLARVGLQMSSPAPSASSSQAPDTEKKRKRELERLIDDTTPTPKRPRMAPLIKTEEDSNLSNVYSTPESSRLSRASSIFDHGEITPALSAGQDPSALTDATSGDDETIVVIPRKKHGRKQQLEEAPTLANKTALEQIESGEPIILGPNTSVDHPVVETDRASLPQQLLEIEPPNQTNSSKKLKRPSTSLSRTLAKTSKKNNKPSKKAAKPQPPTDIDHGPSVRVPGDYTLTPLLLAQPASAWIACKICDEFFVQLDAYFTRSACPRCERHSKLYGFRWPKTDKEGRNDSEERVTDHRTIHRFIKSDEERAIRKRARGASTAASTPAAREASEVHTDGETPMGRRSGRVRAKRSRFTL